MGAFGGRGSTIAADLQMEQNNQEQESPNGRPLYKYTNDVGIAAGLQHLSGKSNIEGADVRK